MLREATDTRDLGRRLRWTREREHLSQGTVAALLGVRRAAIEAIEHGRPVAGPELQRVARWLDAAGRARTRH